MMGEYADMAVDAGFTEWEELERAIDSGDYEHDDASFPGMRLPRAVQAKPSRATNPCRGCGKAGLYWLKVDDKWRLHHYTMFGEMVRPGYTLHRCGYASDGTPIAPAAPQDGTSDAELSPGRSK